MDEQDSQELLAAAKNVVDTSTYDEAGKRYVVSTEAMDRLTDIEVKLNGL